MIKKPMLAVAMDSPDRIQYPVLASPKLDGIRCLIHPSLGPVSRKFKPIPNDHIRKLLDDTATQFLDGEIITLNPDGTDRTFNEVQGDVMRVWGTPDFRFKVFDCFEQPEAPFMQRLSHAEQRVKEAFYYVQMVPHFWVKSSAELQELDEGHVKRRFEGTMTRDPYGKYKEGRSTLKQGWLLKLKQFADAEGVVVGVEEKMHNANKAERDELGHTKRSGCNAGLRPAGTAGALVLSTPWGELRVGTGFDDNMRDAIWRDPAAVIGRVVTFKFQPSGMQDKPRFPVFKGFRDRRDM